MLRVVFVSTLLACAPKMAPVRSPVSAEQELAEAWNQDAPWALQARFSVSVRSPEGGGTTVGGIIIHEPDRVRLELQTPMYTPFMALASDGSGLNLWLHHSSLFLRGDDALEVLDEISGGSIGLADVLLLMTGRLPLEGAEVESVRWLEDEVEVQLSIDPRFYARAWLVPDTDTVRLLEIWTAPDVMGGEESLVLRVEVVDTMRVGRSRLPEKLSVDLPGIDWQIEMKVESWDVLGVIPDVFSLTAAPGVQQVDLVETIRALLES